jgi:hypothetical protein
MYQDLTNKRFGKLLVIEQAPAAKNKSFRWFCKCDCGKELKVKATALIDGITKSCGCEYGKPQKGLRFGRLEISDLVVENNQTFCICLCDCGNYTKERFSTLKRGDVKSCGCLGKEIHSKGNPVHGLYYTRLYKIYRGIMDRCFCKTSSHYSDWGGRGITVCDDWIGKNGFIKFYNWAKSNGYSDDLSIDRIDNNGNYCPQNCRWATAEEQQNNTRRNLILFYRGEKLTLSQASKKMGLSTSTIWHRIKKYGNDLEIALKEPIRHELSRYKEKKSGH